MKVANCLFLLFLTAIVTLPQQKFRTGVYSNLSPTMESRENLQQISEMGVNTVINTSRSNNRTSLNNLFDSVIIFNAYYNTDYIHHYSAGYYTRWEAENNEPAGGNTPGVKYEFGTDGGTYWKSGLNSANIGKYLITGPDYNQDRKYKFWYNTDPIVYIVNFRMKIDGNLTPGTQVCEISVKYRTANGDTTTLRRKTLNANDLSNSFDIDTLHYTIPETINGTNTEIPPGIISGGTEKYTEEQIEEQYLGPYGVQFNIKWLGNRDLYVDYIEVYDEYVWKAYLDDSTFVKSLIQGYASANKTNNTKYWYSLDEPQSIDNYAPYKVVESILKNNGQSPLITAFYPGWDGVRNNEWTIKRFIETVQPNILMYDYHPYYYDHNGTTYTDELCLRFQRELMQSPFNNGFPLGDYYYVTQSFGYTPHCTNYQSRKPNSKQLRASVMLALAHGTKGIFLWPYYSYKKENSECGGTMLVDAIVDTNGTPTELYYEIKNNLFARLNSTLGNTLIKLKYNGSYIDVTQQSALPVSNDFLTLQSNGSDFNWHIGFLVDKIDQENEHFLLVNLRTDTIRTAKLLITNNSGYSNLRVKNVEDSSLDTTVTAAACTLYQTLQAGDGKLYQVAPVVKYGDKIKTSETINGSIILNGEMTVESGATLTISGTCTYDINQNITVNSGATLIINPGATLKFAPGKSLIINGILNATGNASNKIKFYRSGTTGYWGGIQFNSGSTGNLQYCDIKNAYYGIYTSNSNPIISNCNITNNNYGLKIHNSYTTPSWSNVHISGNNITNNSAYGLYVYNSSPTLSNNNTSNNWIGAALWYDSDPIIEGTSFNNNSSYGLACYGSASPNLNYNSSYDFGGYNIVTGNNYSNGAIRITGSSFPNLGEPSASLGGYNSILNNTGYEVYNSTSQMIFACNNWWGDEEGLGTSTLYGPFRWIPYLTSDPNPQQKSNLSKPVYAYDEESELPEDLQIANFEQNISEYKSSADKFKKHFTENKESKYNSYSAEQHIKSLSCYLEPKSVVEEIERTLSEKYDNSVQYELLTGLSLKLSIIQQSEKAIEKLDEALRLKLEEEQEDRVLSLKAMVYIYDLKETEKGKAIFEEIVKSSSKDSPWYELAASELNIISSKSSLPKISIESNFVEIPDEYKLVGNYPNPFNPTTKISYQLPNKAQVTLKIYDLLGREIAILVNEEKQAGKYEVEFDARSLSSGVYLYRISINDFVKTLKMVVIK